MTDTDTLIDAILTTDTMTAAAKVAGCSRKTLYNRLQDETFRAMLDSARAERRKRLDDVIDSAAVKAINALVSIAEGDSIFSDTSERIRAAELVLKTMRNNA